MNVAALIVAAHLTRSEAYSAMPDAPVVPEPERRESLKTARTFTARVLRRAADRVEPTQQHCS